MKNVTIILEICSAVSSTYLAGNSVMLFLGIYLKEMKTCCWQENFYADVYSNWRLNIPKLKTIQASSIGEYISKQHPEYKKLKKKVFKYEYSE